ncbi:hypothetical protein D9619_002136 [Psilocybe cf. subviscida]|uniref:Uncharacterized protein n=1 Tax=Psilocybe cf. subviscida TaxID=2480587 RepID=A0A8H5BF59_9AGAR|nr:hypothetical protein D9619_002136 [Psilocybe cf. subviscida]
MERARHPQPRTLPSLMHSTGYRSPHPLLRQHEEGLAAHLMRWRGSPLFRGQIGQDGERAAKAELHRDPRPSGVDFAIVSLKLLEDGATDTLAITGGNDWVARRGIPAACGADRGGRDAVQPMD